MTEQMLKIGSYKPGVNGNSPQIIRDWYNQGWVVKDDEAFYDKEHPDRICYIPEGSDSLYSRNDFLRIADGLEDLAEELYSYCDWQHPESALEDLMANEEVIECPKCKHLIWLGDEEDAVCPHCNEKVHIPNPYF